jgi:flavodoxin I
MPGIAVLVDSRGGNTKKVAEAIARELGTSVGDIHSPVPAGTGVLFLGSGVYGGKPGKALARLIETTNFAETKVALFATSGGAESAEKMLANLADAVRKKGATVLGTFHCRGKFLFSNRGHPNGEDLERAKKFAREMLAKV